MMKMELMWKDVPGYESYYQISTMGEIKNKKTNKLLKLSTDKDGYLQVGLSKDHKRTSFRVHRLVAQTFIPNPDDLPAVNHKDENKVNNNINNLEWCTIAYNNMYSKARKINQYTLDGIFIKTWNSIREAARETGCNFESIQGCCSGKYRTTTKFIWKYEDDLNQYKLWYIDECNKAWFTNMYSQQWADDANDAPYEHNVGEPYTSWSELIKDDDDVTKKEYKSHPIKLKTLYFETNDWTEQKPCSNYSNSPYSVETINKGVVPWLWTKNFKIFTGTTMKEFIKTIEDNGGIVYLKKEKTNGD